MNFEPLYATWRGIAEDKRKAVNDADDKRRQGEMDERLRRQDFEGILTKVHGLIQAGRHEEAAALAAAHPGAKAAIEHYMADIPGMTTADTPAMPGARSTPQEPPQGGSPLPDRLEFQDRDPEAAAVMPGGAAPRGPGSDPTEALMQRAMTENKPAEGADKLLSAANFGKEKQAQRMHTRLRVTMPSGQQITMDPTAERDSRMARVDAAFKDVDPAIATMYHEIRPILAMSDQEVNPRELFMLLRSQKTLEGQQARDEARQADRDKSLAQGAALRREGFAQSDTNNRRTTGAMLAGAKIRGGYTIGPEGTAGPRELAEAGTVVKELDEALKPFTEKGGIRERLAHSDAAIASLKKAPENPTNWVNAIDAAIRTNTGRAAILSQYKLYTGHAAGTDDQLHQWAESFLTGNPSAAQKKNLFESFKISNDELRHEAQLSRENIEGYGKDPRVQRNRSAGEALSGHLRGAFGATPGVEGAQPQAGPARKSNPIIDARAVGKLPPADQSLAKQAISRLARNPDDATAKEWLQAHGLGQ